MENSKTSANRRHRSNQLNRPPGLRGREIGFYYRNLARQRKRNQSQDGKLILGPSVSVPSMLLRRVDEHLTRFAEDALINGDTVCQEFQRQFKHMLLIDFNAFIEETKSAGFNKLANDEILSAKMQSELSANAHYKARLEKREQLPTMKQREAVLSAVRDNQVILIAGSTGCGKTTQVPQILLDDCISRGFGASCHIVCTQPRRISAVSVAERVAYERCENLGCSVGYQIRLESTKPREKGSILYCTTGILLQKMQTDPLMSDLNIVVLDEVHERSVETDILMALLKKIMPFRTDLKIILMSATISEQDFQQYFDNCCTLRIEGTIFPVEVLYLENILAETYVIASGLIQNKKTQQRRKFNHSQNDSQQEFNNMMEPYLRQIRGLYDQKVIDCLRNPDLEGCKNLQFVEFLIFYICKHKPAGAILVFLPGYDKISKLNSILKNPTHDKDKQLASQIQVYPLHSQMPTVNQQSVFAPPPKGMRKVILSTILAETSVTIEDVVYVINTGRTKVSSYDAVANIQTLQEAWVTRANTQQRKGRAGRVQPGICYNLFSRARERTMADSPIPEILCSKLENIILRLKLLHIHDVFEFLQTVLSAPNPLAVENGIKLLKRIEALDDMDNLTPLGVHLARLPIEPQMSKMILMASLFQCLDPITSVAAALSFKSPFQTPLGKESLVDKIKQDLAMDTRSDHLLVDNVIVKYREALTKGNQKEFCWNNFLNEFTVKQLERMKQQFVALMHSYRFTDSGTTFDVENNVNSKNIALLRAIIAAGLYPNMAFMRKVRQIRNRVQTIQSMSTPEERSVNFHPSSVNRHYASFASQYFVYYQKQKSSSVFLLDATMVFPIALLIFGDGVEVGIQEEQTYISVAKTYNFKCDPDTGHVIMNLREHLKWLLQKKALYPSPISPGSGENNLIKAIQILLSIDEIDEHEDQYPEDDDL